ncbi:MAG: hypothetical protein MIK27_05480 [Sphingomonas sanguinis]|uniref:Uncharacterized protein n=1 Tax=Sphingomonas sanguinis TaxID=33051 RepID=A0ABX1UG43_9SPHN|nr:hypothetical protein [Sphingomonas sanguinis]NNG50415.1 hypothetical protein [Sphingomonas sanguinis]NNG53114.1 hypothetical protein [Sphingomonas sanguinis]
MARDDGRGLRDQARSDVVMRGRTRQTLRPRAIMEILMGMMAPQSGMRWRFVAGRRIAHRRGGERTGIVAGRYRYGMIMRPHRRYRRQREQDRIGGKDHGR